MSGLTYDTDALIAAAKSQIEMWRIHEGALRRGVKPTVPAVVLAQAWRGGGSRQAQLSRLLAGCAIEVFDEDTAREVGLALAVAKTSDIVDAAVVTRALGREDAVVTSDPDDLIHITHALNKRLRLHTV